MARSSQRRSNAPERPVTFNAAERLGAFELAQLWSDRMAFERWHEWATRQRDFIIHRQPGITDHEYETVERRFAAVGITSPG
jgi:hypothetical protein